MHIANVIHSENTKEIGKNNPKDACLRISRKLDKSHIEDMVDGSFLAIQIKSYAEENIGKILSDYIFEHENRKVCAHNVKEGGKIKHIDYGVDAIAESYNTAYGETYSEEFKKYYKIASTYHRFMREACAPYLNPFDKFRLELDEVWPDSVGIAHFDGCGKGLTGLGRIVRSEENILVSKYPHTDHLPIEKAKLKAQLAVNIYLDVPSSGGELEVWGTPLSVLDNYRKLNPNKEIRSKYPPDLSILPSIGDLIIVNARNPHAVQIFSKGRRVTIQSFLGVHEDNSISLWS